MIWGNFRTLVKLFGMPGWACLMVMTMVDLTHAVQRETELDIVGLSVTSPRPDSEYGESAVLGRQAGTEVHLRCRDKNKFFIGLAEKDGESRSSVRLLDDDGKELPNDDNYSMFGFASEFSDDGHEVLIPVSASGLPPAECAKIHVRGTLVLISGKDETTESVTFEVSQGIKTKLGNVDVQLSEIEESPYGEPGWMLSFESSQDMDAIAEIKFMDEAGKELESTSAGGGSYGFDDQMTYTRNIVIEGGQPAKLTAQVRYFKSTEDVSIPVDLPVTLGLGQK